MMNKISKKVKPTEDVVGKTNKDGKVRAILTPNQNN